MGESEKEEVAGEGTDLQHGGISESDEQRNYG